MSLDRGVCVAMDFFNTSGPLLRRKQEAMDLQDLRGLLRIDWRVGNFELFSSSYTRIDQIFLVWGWITVIIFATAQFLPISWHSQAIMWSGLTTVGVASMSLLAWFWVKVERLRWVVYAWAALMMLGVLLTDCGIFWGWSWVLINLCQLWLSLIAVGYLLTGWGVRSRTFCLAGIIHLIGLALLPYFSSLPFLFTGSVIAGTLLFLAEVQWDMRPPSDSVLLSDEENRFNREQQERRMRDEVIA